MPSLDIEWLQPDGSGAARGPHGVVVIPGAIPGDRVRYAEESRRGRSVKGRLEALERPSDDRQPATCPYSDQCGGCDLDRMRHEARVASLARMVAHTLRLDAPPPVLTAGARTGHRARISLTVEAGRVGYRPPRSHAHVPIRACESARPEINAVLDRLANLNPTALEGADRVELRSDGERAVAVVRGRGPSPSPELRDAVTDIAWNGRIAQGNPVLTLQVHGHPLRVSPESFYQVNLEGNQRVVERVTAWARDVRPERVVDLYCGMGNLTVPLAHAVGVPVVGVEMAGSSTADLRHNAASLPVTVVESRVERADLTRIPFDLVVLDPPRAGAPGVLRRIARQRPRRIIIVSCNPVSAARDLRELKGYTVTDVACVDLFPQTHHIETLICLDRV